MTPVPIGSLKSVKLDHPKQSEDAAIPSLIEHQFLAHDAAFSVLSVFNAEGSERQPCPAGGEVKVDREREREGEGEEEKEGEGEGGERGGATRKVELGKFDFGSCRVALTLNSRLLVLQIPHK